MNPIDIKVLIQELPALIMYIAPGYLFIWMVRHVTSGKMDNDNHLVLKSVILSYLFVSVAGFIYKKEPISSIEVKIAILVAATIIGYITGLVLRSDKFWALLRKVKIFPSNGYFFNDIGDFQYGVWATAYLPGDKVIYIGEIRKYELRDDSENTFIVLAKYIQYDYNGEEEVNHREEDHYHVVLNTKDISRLEIYYNERSQKIW